MQGDTILDKHFDIYNNGNYLGKHSSNNNSCMAHPHYGKHQRIRRFRVLVRQCPWKEENNSNIDKMFIQITIIILLGVRMHHCSSPHPPDRVIRSNGVEHCTRHCWKLETYQHHWTTMIKIGSCIWNKPLRTWWLEYRLYPNGSPISKYNNNNNNNMESRDWKAIPPQIQRR